ncbi:hypothetical protein Q7P37_004626 [Cladosporium fusiforme]
MDSEGSVSHRYLYDTALVSDIGVYADLNPQPALLSLVGDGEASLWDLDYWCTRAYNRSMNTEGALTDVLSG